MNKAAHTTTPNVWMCDSCEAQHIGATYAEIRKAGWELHRLQNGSLFTLCPACVTKYAKRRELRAALHPGT